jgi:microcin C transport system permease protein
VLEEIRKQYVLTARAKGVDERDVLWKHVFRNALIPIMTGFPAAFVGAFFSGSLLIETLFLARTAGTALLRVGHPPRLPVVFGSLYLFTIIGLLTTCMRDLSYVWVDPRVKYLRSHGQRSCDHYRERRAAAAPASVQSLRGAPGAASARIGWVT